MQLVGGCQLSYSSMIKLELVKFSGTLPRCIIISFYIANTAFLIRVVSTVIVTARNVTYALNATPESSAAYESSEKIWNIIKDSNKTAELQNGGKNKKVYYY